MERVDYMSMCENYSLFTCAYEDDSCGSDAEHSCSCCYYHNKCIGCAYSLFDGVYGAYDCCLELTITVEDF